MSEIIIKILAEITLITDDQEKVFESVKNGDIDILFLDIDFKGKGKRI